MKNIYVGNLSFGASEESVRALFETHGTVGRVNVVMDRDTGQPRGFGFVEMASAGDAATAIQRFNDTALKGRNIKVNEAKPRESKFSGGGGGGGGRNRW